MAHLQPMHAHHLPKRSPGTPAALLIPSGAQTPQIPTKLLRRSWPSPAHIISQRPGTLGVPGAPHTLFSPCNCTNPTGSSHCSMSLSMCCMWLVPHNPTRLLCQPQTCSTLRCLRSRCVVTTASWDLHNSNLPTNSKHLYRHLCMCNMQS